MISAVLIPVDGTLPAKRIELPDGLHSRMKAMQDLFDGPFELVVLDFEHLVFCGENAKLRPHRVNERATRLLSKFLMPADYIAGDALVTGTDHEGEIADCPEGFENGWNLVPDLPR